MNKFSNYVRIKKRQLVDRENWVIGWDYLLLLFAGIFSAFMTTTMYRDISPAIVDIAVYQMLMILGGMVFGFVVTMKGIGSVGIVVRPPTREDITKMAPYLIVGFAVLTVINRLILLSGLTAYAMTAFSSDMNIALTAAVAEEAVYSFGFTTFFFKVFNYLSVNVMGQNILQENLSVFMTAAVVSILFVVIHIGVYGLVTNIVLMLFINRFVYAFIYMKTRNLTAPTLLHIIHNAMTFL